MAKSKVIGIGEPCPKCKKPMARKAHPPGWEPKPSAAYYFDYWDTCKKCPHLQHYEAAKHYLVSDDGPRLTERTSDWMGTPPPYEGAPPWE